MKRSIAWALAVGAPIVVAATIVGVVGPARIVALARHRTAMDVCRRLEEKRVAIGCADGGAPHGIGGDAKEYVTFDLPDVPGKTGQVLWFSDDDAFARTEEAFANAQALAGRHRYGNPSSRIFVQLNSQATDFDGYAARQVVDEAD